VPDSVHKPLSWFVHLLSYVKHPTQHVAIRATQSAVLTDCNIQINQLFTQNFSEASTAAVVQMSEFAYRQSAVQ